MSNILTWILVAIVSIGLLIFWELSRIVDILGEIQAEMADFLTPPDYREDKSRHD